MNKRHIKILESINTFFQNSVLSTIFIFKSNIYQIGSIFEKTLAPILFPLVIIPDALASLFALYHFAKAKNKNLGKTIDLIHAPIKAALVFTAVFAGLSLIFVQSLFLTAVGSSVIYHLGLSIFHTFHWLKSEKNSPARTLHKNHTINNFIATIIGGIVVAGIILTMVVAPYLAATILAVAGITAATLLMLTTVFTIYRNFKNPPLSPTINLLNQSRPEIDQSSPFDHLASLNSNEEVISTPKNKNSNYYHREFRSEKLIGNQEEDKKKLLGQFKNKKVSILQKIGSSKNSFFEYICPQEAKRLAKINGLQILKSAVAGNNKALVTGLSNIAFQSFYKDVGDFEDIYQATEHYFQKHFPN